MAQTLGGILDELFEHHSDREHLEKILANQVAILANQLAMLESQERLEADLDAIRIFLGVTDPIPGESQRVIDEQTAALKQLNTDLQSVLPKEN